MKNKTIIELWKHNGGQLPFAVRRNTWSDNHYAVIHEVKPGKLPYGHAFGIYFFGGKPKTEAPEQISSAGCYQWELVEGFGFKKGEYKGKKKALRVYRKDEMFDFGNTLILEKG
ncbi:MAG: hypothetical protein M0P70_10135 [Desulfobulbaceae bacterium]|nr:hypothetical protein [Desulfobulbaceae bacterium]